LFSLGDLDNDGKPEIGFDADDTGVASKTIIGTIDTTGQLINLNKLNLTNTSVIGVDRYTGNYSSWKPDNQSLYRIVINVFDDLNSISNVHFLKPDTFKIDADQAQIEIGDSTLQLNEETQVTVRLFDENNTPLTGFAQYIDISSSLGSFSTWSEVSPGVYQATFTASTMGESIVSFNMFGSSISEQASIVVTEPITVIPTIEYKSNTALIRTGGV
jgi:hypothetical protein